MKMLFLQTAVLPRPFCATKFDASWHPMSLVNVQNPSFGSAHVVSHLGSLFYSPVSTHHIVKSKSCSVSRKSHSKPEPEPEPSSNQRARPEATSPQPQDVVSSNDNKSSAENFPTIIPRKKRRGRRSEAMAVEDFVRDSLERTFDAIRQQNSDVLENHENIMKGNVRDDSESESNDDDDDDDDEEKEKEEEEEEEEEDNGDNRGKKMMIEEENQNWPLDADVGWGVRASEYFENHPIKNVVGENGVEIDWEGEIDDNWVREINCLEWESFAFHPSPLIVLVFERYNRANDNWKNLKELEKAIKVYWSAKDRLPPRAVKIDINIERDLAYALKVRECPQILFLRGNRIVYRETELRTADELVQMIAFFYYNAKKPAWIDDKALYSRY
ncbi:thioredoxin-like fold domain-containing protein MRL7, chloroplastic [Gastrolobium bilobum]|uniref:thioredoxin-like fold domain-containing protein MRL7, chloroplastic n=1 Tax=Gastrolobium bilobum TaxID=150636 RepID=UPI002AB0DC6A|nr:thioredoxin-like fold domain-containing protein MRL7, chloroplastic [Gastrolobium bilobum]